MGGGDWGGAGTLDWPVEYAKPGHSRRCAGRHNGLLRIQSKTSVAHALQLWSGSTMWMTAWTYPGLWAGSEYSRRTPPRHRLHTPHIFEMIAIKLAESAYPWHIRNMADRMRRLTVGIITSIAIAVASLIAPSLVHTKIADARVITASQAASDDAMPCHHVQMPKHHCPGNDCQGALGCLAKCAQAAAIVTAEAMPLFKAWANLVFSVPSTPLGDRSIPPLLRPPIV